MQFCQNAADRSTVGSDGERSSSYQFLILMISNESSGVQTFLTVIRVLPSSPSSQVISEIGREV